MGLMLLAYCVGVSSEEIMFKCKFSRLERSLRREQFMLHETCAWAADGQTPSGAHQGASKSVFGEPPAFAFDPTIFPHLCQDDTHFPQLVHRRLAGRYLPSVSHGRWSRGGYQLLTSQQEFGDF